MQVRGLLQLFLDIERTDRSNTFYEKFTTRYKAGEILCEILARCLQVTLCQFGVRSLGVLLGLLTGTGCSPGYLWTIPQHREVWKRLAAEGGGRGLYLSFCDVVCNDSQYLLDDVIKTLPEVILPRSRHASRTPARWAPGPHTDRT